jgi:hypothetical protein
MNSNACYLEVLHQDALHPDYEEARRAFSKGFEKDAWAGNVHHVNRNIRTALGVHRGKPFELASRRVDSQSRLSVYWLDFATERIVIASDRK